MNYIQDKKGLIQPESDLGYQMILKNRQLGKQEKTVLDLTSRLERLERLLDETNK